jgi:GntR family transcriptional regulator
MDPEVTIRIDLKSTTPVYRQIADALRALVVEKKLQPGDRLPTVRELGMELVVHHNTVAQAYRELASEGWLELVRGRGAAVRDRTRPRPTKAVEANFEKRLRELIAIARSNGLDKGAIADILRHYPIKEKEARC